MCLREIAQCVHQQEGVRGIWRVKMSKRTEGGRVMGREMGKETEVDFFLKRERDSENADV